jgi:hypothetical protein
MVKADARFPAARIIPIARSSGEVITSDIGPLLNGIEDATPNTAIVISM